MEILLVRHAIAGNPDAERWPDDALRPLTEKGRARFEVAAHGIARLAPRVDRHLTSPFVRARETADILAEAAGWPDPVEARELAPGGGPAAVLDHLEALRDSAAVALVGHQPDMTMLAAYLLAGESRAVDIEFRKGAVACLTVEALRPGQATLRWLLQPRHLRALAKA